MAESFRDLVTWQKAMALVTSIYSATDSFPRREWYGLASQLRQAGVSVPSNIAEGKGRLSKKEFVQFLGHARGSICEVQTQLEIARNLQFLSEETFKQLDQQAQEVGRILNGLIRSVRDSMPRPNAPKTLTRK
jgi:four helix bundle protein